MSQRLTHGKLLAHAVNATVRSDLDDYKKVEVTDDLVPKLVVQEDDFLGERVDYVLGRVKVLEKTLDKVKLLWAKRDGGWSCRSVTAMYSLLFYCSRTLAIPLAPYFDALRFLRRLASWLNSNTEKWDHRVDDIPPCVLEQLGHWTERVMRNEWRTIDRDLKPERFIVTDASAEGWGGISWDGHSIKTIHHRWSDADRQKGVHLRLAKSSSIAEPFAILKTLLHFLRPNSDDAKKTVVFTDHKALVYSIIKGNSPSYVVNSVIDRINTLFPGIRVAFVAGKRNPADEPSRIVKMDSAKYQQFLDEEVQRVASAERWDLELALGKDGQDNIATFREKSIWVGR